MKAPGIIFFDLDDTLFPSIDAYDAGLRESWKVFRSMHRIAWPLFQKRYESARQRVKRQLEPHPAARDRQLYFKALTEDVLGHSHPPLTLRLMAAYEKAWRSARVGPTRDLLRRLHHGRRLGIITNQVTRMQMQKLMRLDPGGRLFEVVVTSDEVGVEKPDLRIYREACRRARCRPGEAWMVGNSLRDDVRGALHAGLRAVWIHPGPPSRLPAGALQVRSLGELVNLLP